MIEQQLIEKFLTAMAASQLDAVHVYAELDSTNSEAIRLLESGTSGAHLLLAEQQTAGRGRRGRSWKSPAGAGLYLSLLHPFPGTDQQVNGLQALSLVTALSVLQTLAHFGAEDIQLKWPNDIVSNRKKIAGILLEMRAAKELTYIVFGIGINYSLSDEQKAAIDRPVIDLRSLSANLPTREQLAARVCSQLLENIGQFSAQGFAPFQSDWNNHDRYLGADVVIEDGARRLVGQSAGVDDQGVLLLQTTAGQQRIQGGEIFPSLREIEEVC